MYDLWDWGLESLDESAHPHRNSFFLFSFVFVFVFSFVYLVFIYFCFFFLRMKKNGWKLGWKEADEFFIVF